jgi:hypothetical protein
MATCKGTKKDGTPCTKDGYLGGFCATHNPRLIERKKAARNRQKVLDRLHDADGTHSGCVKALEALKEEIFAKVMDGVTAYTIDDLGLFQREGMSLMAKARVAREVYNAAAKELDWTCRLPEPKEGRYV